MDEKNIRSELYAFYLCGDAERSKAFADKCFEIMDSRFDEKMTVTEQKLLQYDVICEEFEPKVFRYNPFFYETGVLTSLSDGAYKAKGHRFYQANGWVYKRNEHLFIDQDKELYERRLAQAKECLYLICGPYNDTAQHFNFNIRPILEVGLRGIYEKAEAELTHAKTAEETEFLRSVCRGMDALRRMAQKFAKKAEEMLLSEKDEACKNNLGLVAKTACRVPWEPPKTLYEALATLAFLRTAVGSLEGVGPNTFGRVDKDLITFLRADIDAGRLTKEEAYELICTFLMLWDCHYDHEMPMEGYADHELENTYTLGGCDDSGEPLYNEITEMFLRASREKNIIFPKIKCRFSKDSPKEYLDAINTAISKGTSTVLLQNDGATVPALVRAGRTLSESRDYIVSGCWGVTTMSEKFDHGSYLNLLRPFEYAVHGLKEKSKLLGIDFEYFEGDESFEEIYKKTLANCERVLCAKLDVTRKGGRIYHKVDRLPIFSSTLGDCIENRRDFTAGGAKYKDDMQLLFGFPNIVDSLLAIKSLVFDKKLVSFYEYLCAVRANFEGHEELRLLATRAPGWGDGSEESTSLAARFNSDLFSVFERQTGTHGGRVHMGHLTYTEIRWWGEKTLATPDGRKNGEYFSQGLTPSRLKRIPVVLDVVNSLSALDPSMVAGNSVVNIMLPSNTPLDRLESFLRAAACTALQSLQLNCASKDTLIDAQNHPEKYPDLIVRVTGFSAKFTSLSKGWQDEIISRNFYD